MKDLILSESFVQISMYIDIGTPSCTSGGRGRVGQSREAFIFKGGGPLNVFDIITRMCSVRSRAHLSLYC